MNFAKQGDISLRQAKEILASFSALCLCTCIAPGIEAQSSDTPLFEPGSTLDFTFESSELKLSGIFDVPETQDTKALIIFVHGYGPTNVREWNAYADLRQRFNDIGIATAVWDKPGLGESEGEFDINQSVYESAQEVVDAAKTLRELDAPGSERIGIWGLSRAGWIAPISLSMDSDIDFWISVSGTTKEDNFSYLLLSNLPYEGGSFEEAALLADEWRDGCEIRRAKGSFEDYQAATVNLRANEYILQQRGPWQTREQYDAQRESCGEGSCQKLEDDMCSYIYIDDFDDMLSSVSVDVLAIFGEKDLNIDWRKTRAFYADTLGNNTEASLEMYVFANADHNLNIAEIGSIKEMQSGAPRQKPDGYYDIQIDWLRKNILSSE